MTPDQAQHVIKEALAQVAPDVDIDGITPDTDLRDDLGLDSLDFLRFVEILSERTGSRIAEDDYPIWPRCPARSSGWQAADRRLPQRRSGAPCRQPVRGGRGTGSGEWAAGGVSRARPAGGVLGGGFVGVGALGKGQQYEGGRGRHDDGGDEQSEVHARHERSLGGVG